MTTVPRFGQILTPAGRTVPLRVSYSAPFCLYQLLLSRTRQHSVGAAEPEPVWLEAVRTLSRVYLPLGPFNYLEFALASAESSDSIPARLEHQGAELGARIAEVVTANQTMYERSLWPRHQAELEIAIGGLAELLDPHKDALLEALACRLGVTEHPAGYEVHLVAECHEPTGAYSHPTVVSVQRFAGLALVETLVHELGHVLAHHAKHTGGSLWQELSKECWRRGRPRQFALQLFHLLLFHAGASVVREVVDRDYRPQAVEHRLFEKFSRVLGVTVDQAVLERHCATTGGDPRGAGASVVGLLDELLG
ncbi:MAG TPA: hypothetical protein VHQ65_15555 [Thermoanaerobaculia bacterium]|nr:hypothetical protein [Thermoanaerobaculia bacterium]